MKQELKPCPFCGNKILLLILWLIVVIIHPIWWVVEKIHNYFMMWMCEVGIKVAQEDVDKFNENESDEK